MTNTNDIGDMVGMYDDSHKSEDERIVNQLIELINSTGGVVVVPENIDELIDWLEKQIKK